MSMLSRFAGLGGAPATYIEDVFSTWLYTGNGSTQTIINGINLAGKGGLVWLKSRSTATYSNAFVDTVRGGNSVVNSNTANPAVTNTYLSFNSDGFLINNSFNNFNNNGTTYASWTFRKQPKFFDVVTYTGNGASGRTILHSLGSAPGFMIIKRTDSTSDWWTWHRSNSVLNGTTANSACILPLNGTFGNGGGGAYAEGGYVWTLPTTTTFPVSQSSSGTNVNGATYVAYLFAHNAGGFGLTDADNVISCGSYTGNGSATGPVVTLGYEPQWLMVKNASGSGNWNIIDNMRGMPVGSADAYLEANTADAEASAELLSPTATGFQITSTSTEVNTNASTYIYIAIRRGPMKVPTDGTSVFKPVTRSGVGTTPWVASGAGFPPDMSIMSLRASPANTLLGYLSSVIDRLRRATEHIQTGTTAAEGGSWGAGHLHNMDGYDGLYTSDGLYFNRSGATFVDFHFRRAPGFFDVVCYTGTGVSNTAIAHNLGVVPEFVISKTRGIVDSWNVWAGGIFGARGGFSLNGNGAVISTYFNAGTYATASNVYEAIQIGNNTSTNVAYLFASCPGVSKVGSYTGTGTTQQINCGFTGGARFVLIKRTDSTGDWYVWDTARGIVAGNDPYLLLNSDTNEVTTTDYIDAYSAGFEISSTAPAAINASGGTFIYLAIA